MDDMYWVYYKDEFLSFFADYPRAVAYCQGHRRAMGETSWDNYEVAKNNVRPY